MDIYIEEVYIINMIIILITYSFLTILLNIYWSSKQLILYTFLTNISIFVLYINRPILLILYWYILFYILFARQFFLYFPVFIIVYFSILLFFNSVLKESMIYCCILITPLQYHIVFIISISLILFSFLIIYIKYVIKKHNTNKYTYPIKFNHLNKTYHIQAYLDTGNHAYYKGYPLIFIKRSLIDDYTIIDTMMISGIIKQEVEIIMIDKLYIHHQCIDKVYAGIIHDLEKDCLLNSELMGGIL